MIENYALNPTEERRKQGQGLMKETLSPTSAPLVARYKARAPFTLLAMRMQILEDAKERPKGKKERSIRRRLTPFDRALSDDQAAIIDLLIRAHLAICSKARGSSWEHGVDSSPVYQLPFTLSEHDILAVSAKIKQYLKPQQRVILADLCKRMMPDFEPLKPIDFNWIAVAKDMAASALEIYKRNYGN